MKAVVTGAAGFVGSTLSAHLLAEGWDVVGIDSLTDYYDVSIKRSNLDRVKASGGAFQFSEADLTTADLSELLDGADAVFHQAGQPGVRKSWGADFSGYTRQNVDATQVLLEAAAHMPRPPRIVYASSSSVYGDAERYPTLETDRPQPLSPYGVTKLAAENLCVLYSKSFGLETVSLRYFTVYGPGQRPDMAFTRFLRAAVTGGRIKINGTGEQVRDFTFVEDVVRANILAATTPEVPSGLVANVAGGTSVSVNGVLETLSDLAETNLNVEYGPSMLGDVFQTGGSTDVIERTLGWRPAVSLREGLSQHLAWARATFA